MLCEETPRIPEPVIVERSGDWLVYVHPKFPTDRTVWIQAVDHVEGMWSLTEDKAGSLGRVLRRIAWALQAAQQAERVYVVSLGERYPHLHLLLIARRADDGAERRGVPLVADAVAEKPDPDVAGAAEGALRMRRLLTPV